MALGLRARACEAKKCVLPNTTLDAFGNYIGNQVTTRLEKADQRRTENAPQAKRPQTPDMKTLPTSAPDAFDLARLRVTYDVNVAGDEQNQQASLVLGGDPDLPKGSFRDGTGRIRRDASFAVAVNSQSGLVAGNSTPPDLPDGSRFSHYNAQGMPVYAGIGGYQAEGTMTHTRFVAPGSAWAQKGDRPITYSVDGAGRSYWNTGEKVMSIPIPYLMPMGSDLLAAEMGQNSGAYAPSWNVGTRVMGAIQFVGGVTGAALGATAIAGGGAAVPFTGGGSLLLSAAGWFGFAASVDQAAAGFRTMVLGQQQATLAGTIIEQTTGMSSHKAEFVAGMLTLSPTAAEARLMYQSTNALEASNNAARASYAADNSVVVSGANSELARMSGGLRRPANVLLDDADISRLTQEFVDVGGDPSILRFNSGGQTSYVDATNVIRVRGDVFPVEGALHPRSSMSSKAALAHELGHQAHQGTKVPIGAWNDEFRASYWAAKNAPGLTAAERVDLLSDAVSRAREAGVPIRMNKFMRETLYGY